MARKIVIYLFIVICFIGCTKDTPHNTINPGMKAAFAYQPGSYWIYKDSLTGRIDSFYVISSYFQTYHRNGYDQDVLSIYLSQQNVVPATPGDVSDTALWRLGLSDQLTLDWYDVNLPTGGVGFYLSNYPFAVGKVTSAGSYSTVTNVFPTYTVEGKAYDNTEEIYSSFGSLYTFNDWFYLTENYGLIKMHLYHDYDTIHIHHIWELQRERIIK